MGDDSDSENNPKIDPGLFEPLVIPEDVPEPVRKIVAREQAAALRHAATMVYMRAQAYPEGASAASALLTAAHQLEDEADRLGQSQFPVGGEVCPTK